MSPNLEIICPACGAEALLRREARYEGLKKVGETLRCSACGHEFPGEACVPFKDRATPRIFGEEDKLPKVDLFANDEKGRNCRHCRHYVVNPFTQRCGLHFREVQATDSCVEFEPRQRTDA